MSYEPNFKVGKIPEATDAELSAFVKLARLVRSDPEYAWVLHCNLAMPIKDELHCTHLQANMAAARIISQWFSVDMTKNDFWVKTEPNWSK